MRISEREAENACEDLDWKNPACTVGEVNKEKELVKPEPNMRLITSYRCKLSSHSLISLTNQQRWLLLCIHIPICFKHLCSPLQCLPGKYLFLTWKPHQKELKIWPPSLPGKKFSLGVFCTDRLICAYEESNFLLLTRFYSGVKYILFGIVLVDIAAISFHLMLSFDLHFFRWSEKYLPQTFKNQANKHPDIAFYSKQNRAEQKGNYNSKKESAKRKRAANNSNLE